jgi:hypothetical protein
MPRNPTAQDKFLQTDHLLGPPVGFDQAFPEIESVQVDCTVGGWFDTKQSRRYTKLTIDEYVRCANPRCCDGGFRLGDVLREMSHSRETAREISLSCGGYEGAKRNREPCEQNLKGTAHITYRS